MYEESLHQCLKRARVGYLNARRECERLLEEAATLGPANPDGVELRRRAHAEYDVKVHEFLAALDGYQKYVIASVEDLRRGIPLIAI
jgi:hypothetical protein